MVSQEKLKQFSCPICLDGFKNPKSLVCGHSLCSKCATHLSQTKESQEGTISFVTCPECRKETRIFDHGLPENYHLKELLNLIAQGEENEDLEDETTKDDTTKCWKCAKEDCKDCELTNTEVIKTNMPTGMKSFAETTILHAVQNAKTESQVANLIGNHFRAKYGGFWQCLVQTGKNWGKQSGYCIMHGYCMQIKVENVFVLLFKAAQDSSSQSSVKIDTPKPNQVIIKP